MSLCRLRSLLLEESCIAKTYTAKKTHPLSSKERADKKI